MTPPVTQLDAVVPAAMVMPERIPTAGEAGGGRRGVRKRAFDIGFSAFLVLPITDARIFVRTPVAMVRDAA